MQFLRTLRKFDSEWGEIRARLAHVRALAETLSEPPDFAELEAQEAAARTLYEAHAALNPALAAEFSDRAELAETLTDLQRKTRQLDALRHAPVPEPGEPPADTVTPPLIHEASVLDAEHRAAVAAFEPDWLAIHKIEARATKLRDRIRDAERKHEARMIRHRRHAAAHRRHAADITLLQADIDRLRAYAETLRARLPPEPAAPLREPRRAYRSAAPAELLPLIRARYSYEPATDSIHRTDNGALVRATQSLLIEGHRIPRAAIVAALYDPPRSGPSLQPEDFA